MHKILLVTVGGSHQPIVTAIRDLDPERVVFLCSSGKRGSLSQVVGEGKPCEVREKGQVIEQLPNIPVQAELGERFRRERDVFEITDPDNFAECYEQAVAAIQSCGVEEGRQVMADYTGGTKTMSVGLALAALDYGVALYLTSGTRDNLIKVERGEMTELATVLPVVVRRVLDRTLPPLLAQYEYAAVLEELKPLLGLPLEKSVRERVRLLVRLYRGLDAWDRFDHLEALADLQPLMSVSQVQPLGLFLKRSIAARALLDPQFAEQAGKAGATGHGYEIVEDLVLNAQRRASQLRYDDAVGRLYRAIELLAQLRLQRQYDIATGDLDPGRLPEQLRPQYESLRSPAGGKIQLGLHPSWQLLSALQDPVLGALYNRSASAIQDALRVRNYSILAHGFRPVFADDYDKFSATIAGFIAGAIAALTATQKTTPAVQFPVELLL